MGYPPMLVGSVCTRLSTHVSLSGTSSAMGVAAPTFHSASSSSAVVGTAADFSRRSDCCKASARKRTGIARNTCYGSSRRWACNKKFCSPIRLPPARQPQPFPDTCQHLQTCLLSHTQHSCADLPTIWHAVRPFHSPLTDTIHLSGYRILPPIVSSLTSGGVTVHLSTKSAAMPSGAIHGTVSTGDGSRDRDGHGDRLGVDLHTPCGGTRGKCSSYNSCVFARDGSWNAAWDARPARWLQSQHSTWLLFGVCSCAVVAAAFSSDSSAIQSDVASDAEESGRHPSSLSVSSASSACGDHSTGGEFSDPSLASPICPLTQSSLLSSASESLTNRESLSKQGGDASQMGLFSAADPQLGKTLVEDPQVGNTLVAELETNLTGHLLSSSSLASLLSSSASSTSSSSSLHQTLSTVGLSVTSASTRSALVEGSAVACASPLPAGSCTFTFSTVSRIASQNFTAACEQRRDNQRFGGVSPLRATPKNGMRTEESSGTGTAGTGAGAADIVSGKRVYRDLSVIGIPGDGRCLFRAIAHGACLREGRPAPTEAEQREMADKLRNKVVDELIKKRSEVEWFIEGDFDSYVSNMRKPHTWGGEPELLMSSHVLRMPITVFIPDKKSGGMISIAEYGQEYSKDKPIMVLFNGVGHYDALQGPREEKDEFVSASSKP